MSSKITEKEYPLLKIFGSDFEYRIPAYYRHMPGQKKKLEPCLMICLNSIRQIASTITSWAASF